MEFRHFQKCVFMKKISLTLLLSIICMLLPAQEYLQLVSVLSEGNGRVTFVSTGMADSKKGIAENAAKSIIYTLFYQGVAGVNDGKPLITQDNQVYTNSFFNATARYAFYVASSEEASKPSKVAGKYRADYNVTIYMTRLMNDLVTNKVRTKEASYEDIDDEEGITKPTITVVPFLRDGESYDAVLKDDFDRRIAVSSVQDGFRSRDIVTRDFLTHLEQEKRTQNYEANAAYSNSRALLLSSGADVYVTVDIMKDSNAQGSRVSLIMKACERVTGDVLASKDGWTNRINTTSTDALCSAAVKALLPSFLEDICRNFTARMTQGTRVALRFSIDSGAMSMTMSTPVGPKGYALSDVLRQWVRKNAHKGKYHIQGVVDEGMIFDYVTIPPKAADGMMMDAGEFKFQLEEYLKEEIGLNCTSSYDGSTIIFTIFD